MILLSSATDSPLLPANNCLDKIKKNQIMQEISDFNIVFRLGEGPLWQEAHTPVAKLTFTSECCSNGK